MSDLFQQKRRRAQQTKLKGALSTLTEEQHALRERFKPLHDKFSKKKKMKLDDDVNDSEARHLRGRDSTLSDEVEQTNN